MFIEKLPHAVKSLSSILVLNASISNDKKNY